MKLELDPHLSVQQVLPEFIGTYVDFRNNVSKPPHEETHLRHIFRFYLARSLLKQGVEQVLILPYITLGSYEFTPDVLAKTRNEFTVGICEPDSVTPETEQTLEHLKDADNADAIILYSRFGNPGKILDRFATQVKNKKFRLLQVIPPPFDDVYEYDIWMFELTFREILDQDSL